MPPNKNVQNDAEAAEDERVAAEEHEEVEDADAAAARDAREQVAPEAP